VVFYRRPKLAGQIHLQSHDPWLEVLPEQGAPAADRLAGFILAENLALIKRIIGEIADEGRAWISQSIAAV
jgi:hypothetical protein